MKKYKLSPRNGTEKYNNLKKFATTSDLLEYYAKRIQIRSDFFFFFLTSIITEKCMTK